MADFIAFDEGAERIGKTGMPSVVNFNLSTKSIDATSPYNEGDNYASMGTITGTGYAAKTGTVGAAEFYSTGGTFTFGTLTWSTGAATDWSATCRSCVASTTGTALWAWNLQAGGGARDMSAANTTENVIGTLIID